MKKSWTAGLILVAVGFSQWPEGPRDVAAQQATDGVASGAATIVDGDSLEVDGRRIRLSGIAAPEGRQSCRDQNGQSYACGRAATAALRELIQGQPVQCRRLDVDRYQRWVSDCYAGQIWLNARMVEQGWAVAYTRYDDRFRSQERLARQAKQGIWQGRFTRPEKWRAQQRSR